MPVEPAGGRPLAEVGELALVEALRPYLAGSGGDLTVGSGDDAAVWRPPPGQLVAVTTDSLVEDVHFHLDGDEGALEDLGWKLLAISLSDLAATGAAAGPAVIALALPAGWELGHVLALYRGLAACAGAHGALLAGGNFSRAQKAVLTSTCLGTADPARLLRRSGAEPGWALAVTGCLGGAAAALRAEAAAAGAEVLAAWRRRLRRPEPRLGAGAAIAAAGVTTALDLSDGIFVDAARLLNEAATGCLLRADALPLCGGIREHWPGAWLEVAGGGEDYELLFAGPPGVVDAAIAAVRATGVPACVVGGFDRGPGVRVLVEGAEVAPPAAGYQHFV